MPAVAPASPDSPSPRVAVIVPAYGVARFLGEALHSLQAQTLSDWECVVIDDGAPDDVAGAVAPFLVDSRIRFIQTPNRGVSSARNTAIAESRAPYIALLDGDDRLRSDYLATMVELLDSDPQARIATCNAILFGAVGREQLCYTHRQGHADGVHGSLEDVLDRSFSVYIGSTFRRADFDAAGGFDPSLTQAEDLDLWVRLLEPGGYAYFVDRALADYRVRPGSASSNAARLLAGNMRVYHKARDRRPADAPEQAVIARMIAETQRALDFEQAIARVVAGDGRRGLAELFALRDQVKGPVWAASFALWRLVPALARPMLARRERSRARGNPARSLSAMLAREAA